MVLIHKTEINDQYPVLLFQRASCLFDVEYGQHMRVRLPYEEAAKEYGSCVMHALQCAGMIEEYPD